MDTLGADNGELLDELWLRGKVIAMLQRMIEPGAMGDETHLADMARARRILRRWGKKPCTDQTIIEKKAAGIRAEAAFLRGVMVHKA